MKPQLAENINPHDLPAYVADPGYWFEQKVDGERKLVVVDSGRVSAYGRDGQIARISSAIGDTLSGITEGRWILDGEWIHESFWVFDLLVEHPSMNTFSDPFSSRRNLLEDVLSPLSDRCDQLRLLPSFQTATEKRDAAIALLRNNAEGVMIKSVSGIYQAGKRSRGVLKAKFVATADCIVTVVGREGKRSVALALLDENDGLRDIGSCTMTPPQLATVSVGDVIEVRYLYATGENRLYQPAFVRKRDDKSRDECTMDQLKFTNKAILEICA